MYTLTYQLKWVQHTYNSLLYLKLPYVLIFQWIRNQVLYNSHTFQQSFSNSYNSHPCWEKERPFSNTQKLYCSSTLHFLTHSLNLTDFEDIIRQHQLTTSPTLPLTNPPPHQLTNSRTYKLNNLLWPTDQHNTSPNQLFNKSSSH